MSDLVLKNSPCTPGATSFTILIRCHDRAEQVEILGFLAKNGYYQVKEVENEDASPS